MRKAGISLVALVITIIVLIVLTGAVVITGINVPQQAQLAILYNNVSSIQDAVTMKMANNMIQYGNINLYKWVGVVEEYTAQMAGAGTYPTFSGKVINGESTTALSSEIKASMNISQEEASKYYVGRSGEVYHEGYEYEGKTYYNRNLVVNGTKPTLTDLSDGTYHVTKGVNSPKLLEGMVAVYWDNEGNEIRSDGTAYNIIDGTQIINNPPQFNYNDWYNYIEQIGTTETGGTSKWANAITTADGSYWVWIPRYAYSIPAANYHTSTAGTIGIKFLKGTSNEASDGTTTWDNELGADNWNIHPAFYNEGDSISGNQLQGIWVAKYEMSAEVKEGETWVSKTAGNWYNITTAAYDIEPTNRLKNSLNENVSNILTTAAGNTEMTIRAVSKAGVSAWREIDNSTIFANALSYDSGIGNTTLDSHLMKNSEWGAVAYLTQSKYGRNGTEVTINNSPKYVTGYAGGKVSEGVGRIAETTIKSTEVVMYTTQRGVQASSTGNIYGIYDLSGGSWEKVSAYVDNGHDNLNIYNKNLVANKDTKYVEVYPAGEVSNYTIEEAKQANYNVTEDTKIYGDAIIETSGDGASSSSWNKDYCHFPYAKNPEFMRGGYIGNNTSAGVFALLGNAGYMKESLGWRVVLW